MAQIAQMTHEQLKNLALLSVKGRISETTGKTIYEGPINPKVATEFGLEDGEQYEFSQVNAAIQDQFASMCKSFNDFDRNKHDIFDIIIASVDEVVPAKVISAMQIFAEIRTTGNGDREVFKTPLLGKNRAKKFLTTVGITGVYETFRLDRSTFEVPIHAVGGGISVDFDRLLIGRDSLADVMDVITEALIERVYLEVQQALRSALNPVGVSIPPANRKIFPTFDSDAMFQLCSTVKAYGGAGMGLGGGAVIFAPPEFVGAMGADAIVPVGTNYQGIYHPDDIDAIHKTGYINLFRGIPIVQIPQSYWDESNTETVMDPTMAFVLPTGGERVIKVVMEGGTDIWSETNKDRSIEIMVQKKLGTAIITYHNWGIYQNTSIPQTMRNP